MNFSNDMIEKAKRASSVEELMKMAAAEGIELTAEKAGQYYAFLHATGALSDEELDSVSGGKGTPDPKYRVGQKVSFQVPYGELLYGEIKSAEYSEYQGAWYYKILFENGRIENFPLESDISPAHVIG